MATASTHCFRYVLSDIPPSMTIADYRRNRVHPRTRRSWVRRLFMPPAGH